MKKIIFYIILSITSLNIFAQKDTSQPNLKFYKDTPIFLENRAISKYKNKYGYIDTNNKVVIPHIFDDAFMFYKSFAIVGENNKYCLINLEGKETTPYFEKVEYSSGNLIKVRKNNKWGFIDTLGNIKIDFQFNDASSFNNEISRVKKNGKYFIINKTGKAISEKYEYIYPFYNKIAKVKKNEKYAFINKKGKEISEWYNFIIPYYYGIYKVKKNNRWALTNPKGQITTKWYIDFEMLMKHIKIEQANNKFVFLDENGKTINQSYHIHSQSFDNQNFEINSLNDLYTESILIIRKYGKYAFADKLEIISEFYDEVEQYFEGLAKVRKKKKYAYLDETGKQVTEWFDKIYPFYYGLSRVQKDDKETYINTAGKQITEWFDYAYSFSDGVAKIMKNKKFGFIKNDGSFLLKPQYEDVTSFTHGIAEVCDGEKIFTINKKGELQKIDFFEHIKKHKQLQPENIYIQDTTWRKSFSRYDEYESGYNYGEKYILEDNFSDRNILQKPYHLFFHHHVFVMKNDKRAKTKNKIKNKSKFSKNKPTIERTENKYSSSHIKGRKYTIFDKNNKQLSKYYDFISSFSPFGIAIVRKNKRYAFMNKYGEIISDWFNLLEPTHYYILDKLPKNKAQISLKETFNLAKKEVGKNLCLKVWKGNKNSNFDFITGKQITNWSKYLFSYKINNFNFGIKNEKFYLLDKKDEIISKDFTNIKLLENLSYIVAKRKEKEALYNEKGKRISKFFSNISLTQNKKNFVIEKGKKYAFADLRANKITDYFLMIKEVSDSFYIVKKDLKNQKNNLFVLDENLKQISNFYEEIIPISEQVFAVKKDTLKAFFNIKTKSLSKWYDKVYSPKEGFCIVKKDNKFEFLSVKTADKIGEVYDNTLNFSKGKARVKKDGKWFFINTKGKKIKKTEK